MKGSSTLAWGLLLLAGLGPGAVAAEGGGDAHGIDAAFAWGELVIDFEAPMQVWNNGRGDMVRLEPAVPLQCAWASDSRVSCQPHGDAAFAGATRYRIVLAEGLATQAGERLPAVALEAETERPELRASITRWDAGVPLIEVASDVEAQVAGVAAVLRLAIDGVEQPLPSLERLPQRGTWDSTARFALPLPVLAGHDRHVSLSVVPGFRSTHGPLPGVQARVLLSALVNERFRLRNVRCAGPSEDVVAHSEGAAPLRVDCMPGEPLALVLSDAPDEASRTVFADMLPEEVRLQDWSEAWGPGRPGDRDAHVGVARGHQFALVVDAAGTTVALDAALASLRSARDGAPLEPVDVEASTGDYRPLLIAPRHQALVADGAAIPVKAGVTNVASPLPIRVTALGTGAPRAETLELAVSTSRNIFDNVESEATARALEQGGWARWQLPPGPEDWRGQGRWIEFAAPGFDLVAINGRREVLVWAGAWDGGAAVAGARVELLRSAEGAASLPEVVARAVTDAAGVARIELPANLALDAERSGKSVWLLRAEAGSGRAARRAVLPLDGSWRHRLLGQALQTRMWGVADRPLYRAGDTVRYRLWQRRATGGRLVHLASPPAPLALQLVASGEGKVIRTWSVTPAADGTVAGELDLPVHAPDDTYCIGTGDAWNVEGTCFFVGTYRAQDLWVEAHAQDRVLRDGDRFVVDVEAGYYSGGAAAAVPVHRVTAMLTGRRLQDEYPAYAGFSFVDVMGADARNGIRLDGAGDDLRTDAAGRLRIAQPLEFVGGDPESAPRLPAFGVLQLVAEARLADREGTASNAARARYARHDRYVGLRLHPHWPVAREPVAVDAVVIDADGVAVDGAEVEVEVHYLPGFDEAGTPVGEALARCHVVAGEAAPCDFPRARSGRYRITARSGDAAAADVTRYIHVGGSDAPVRGDATTLELGEAPLRAGDPVRVLLRQPHARARVLFVYSGGDAILGYQVEDIVGGVGTWVLQPPDTGTRGLTLTAYVRASGPAAIEDGYRRAGGVSMSSVSVDLPEPAAAAPLALAFDAGDARPGTTARITLRNDGPGPRDVVLAVVDDAMRALGSEFLGYFDPDGEHWLGALRGRGYSQLAHSTFGGWGDAGLRVPLPWPRATQDGSRGVDAEDGMPEAFGDAAAAVAPPEEPPVVFDAPSPMAAPAPPMPFVGGSDGTSLDRIEVTGSRIEVAEAFAPGPATEHGLRPRESAGDRPARPLARVRTRFQDTALWQPDIRLAPGEARVVELTLPDNLTRWRAVAWSSDADDGFHMVEATLEAGLPLEVRLQAPVRIYPGDAARLAANVHQADADALVVQGSMEVQGLASPLSQVQDVALPAHGQASFALALAPTDVGHLTVVASAEGGSERDAVAAAVEVASPRIEARRLQAGWLQPEGAVLDVPALPAGASDARLDLRLHRGIDALVTPWTRDLHAYPHRCWEQILSRAVAAALAIQRHAASDWPEAQAVVEEALDNAAVFQDAEGGFQFFAGAQGHGVDGRDGVSRATLAAYTVRVFTLLRELGYAVPDHVDGLAREFLESHGELDEDAPHYADIVALAAAAHPPAGEDAIEASWAAWESLSLPARIATTKALAAAGHPAAAEGAARLLEAAPQRGGARVLVQARAQGLDPWMSSRMREQCALIELLGDHPDLAAADVRSGLVAGLRDLYAGGVQSVDTQAGAQCLIALRDLAQPATRRDIAVSLTLDGTVSRLMLPAADDVAGRALALATAGDRTSGGAAAGGRRGEPPRSSVLRITPEALPEAGASYFAELRYLEDAREALPAAVGLSIARRHEVLRDGAWRPVEGASVREGDWLRVTLVVDTSAARHFVAVTDAVPGGLQPTDLALSGIAGLDLEQVSDEGSHWFGTRRLDPRSPRFYAEWLPAGHHEIHYFARAGNAGDYLAAPAVAELMYGDASRARTGAARLGIAVGRD